MWQQPIDVRDANAFQLYGLLTLEVFRSGRKVINVLTAHKL